MSIPIDSSYPGSLDPVAGQCVLVVDDNNLNRDLLRIRLEREGCRVLEAANGEAALSELHRHSIDLVLLDVMMPVMDGVAALHAIKQDPALHDIPVIMVSAVSEMDTVAECITYGADDYLTKPFNPVFLKARLRNSLARKQLQMLERNMCRVSSAGTPVHAGNPVPDEVSGATGFTPAKPLECRDTTASQHHLRVREYSRVLADHLAGLPSHRDRLSMEYRELLGQASLLHDTDMGFTPEQAMLKTGEFTTQQRELMQRHTGYDAPALQGSGGQSVNKGFIDMAMAIAQNHHERWDGKGYPGGLQGEAIPLCARIVALADVYDALTSKRSYKSSFDPDQSKAIILMERGRYFDPDVVDAFLANEQQFCDIQQRYPDGDCETAQG